MSAQEFTLAEEAEISTEANPGTSDWDQFELLRELGVNRLSMGVQSFQPAGTGLSGPHPTARMTRYAAYEAALRAGFANINLDFMFGLPQQSLESWNDTLDKALELAPQHLSLYSLIVEPGTPLAHWVETGQSPPPDDDQAAALYETAMARLRNAGYHHYEVSKLGTRQGVRLPTQPHLLAESGLGRSRAGRAQPPALSSVGASAPPADSGRFRRGCTGTECEHAMRAGGVALVQSQKA